MFLGSFLKDTHGLEFSIYDYLIFICNDLYFVFFIIFLTTMILLYKIIDNIPLKKYLIMKFTSRKVWFLNNMLYIIIFDFLLILFIVIGSIFQSINKTSFINSWSKYGLYKYKNTSLINYTPLNITLKCLLLIFVYVFTIGVFMLMLSLYLKKSEFAIVLILIFNLSNIGIFLAKAKKLYCVSMVNNTLLIYQNNLYPWIYWILLITLLITLSLYKLKKIDF